MSKEQLLQQYREDVENLRKCAKKLSLTDKKIDDIFHQCLRKLNQEEKSSNSQKPETRLLGHYFYTILKTTIFIASFVLFLYILLNVHQPTSSIVLRNVQGLIYPGLKVLRSLSVPIIKKFPQLTDIYDESCLLENPFFYVPDMECWPCENVYSVIDLTGFNNHSLYQTGIPYIAKTYQQEVQFEMLLNKYEEHRAIFDAEANNIKSSNASLTNLQSVFTHQFKESPETHVAWRVNRMLPGRLIRSVFPRPYIVSERAGQSLERYLMIDGAKASAYSFPNTECSYVFVIQGSGQRTIVLKPSQECSDVCRTVSVVLKESYVLWYNWWYWRPISLPSENATYTSTTYISSYC